MSQRNKCTISIKKSTFSGCLFSLKISYKWGFILMCTLWLHNNTGRESPCKRSQHIPYDSGLNCWHCENLQWKIIWFSMVCAWVPNLWKCAPVQDLFHVCNHLAFAL